MNIKVFEQFDGKIVNLYSANRSFSGILMLDIADGTVVLHPHDTYEQIRYGITIVDLATITAIREIKPKAKDAASDFDKCCDEGEA